MSGAPATARDAAEREVGGPAGRLGGLWVAALLAAALAHNLWVSWLKWGNVEVDGGRELELPRRLLEGARLYLDVRNIYGPLAPWLNMALYGAFGVHAATLIAAGIASAVITCAAIWLVARRFLGPWPSALVGAVFLYVFAFGHLTQNPAFNFAFPYAYAATYGAMLATLSLGLLLRHLERGRPALLAWSLACGVAACLTKLEAAAPVLAAHGAVLATAWWTRALDRRAFMAYGLAVAAVALAYGALYLRVGPELWSENLAQVANPGSRRYWLATTGLLEPGDSLLAAARSTGLLLAFGGAALLAGWGTGRLGLPGWALAAAGAALAGAAAAVYARAWPEALFRGLTFLVPAALLWLLARWRAWSARRSDWLAYLVLWAFAAGSLARVPLRAVPGHYGFFLLPVPMVALAVALFRWPAAVAPGHRPVRLLGQWLAVGLLCGAVASGHALSAERYASHRVRLETPRGTLLLADEDREVPGVVARLAAFPPGTTLLTIPIGAGYAFFSGLRGVDGTFSYLPMDLVGRYADDALVARWSAAPPDLVCLVRKDMAEFGFRAYGMDYGQRSYAWIQEHYVPFGGTRSGRVIYRRRPEGEE